MKTSTPHLIIGFTDQERFKTNPYNRCSAYTQEEGDALGFSEREVEKSKTMINGLRRSIRTKGYVPLFVFPVFEKNEDKNYYLLDGAHLYRAIVEEDKEKGIITPINILVYPETAEYSLEDASREMITMNQEGSTKWEFVSIAKSIRTPNTEKFVALYNKYNSLLAPSVIADTVLDKQTSTKRSTFDNIWGTTKDTTWDCADDYLTLLKEVGRKMSQTGSDTLRKLWKTATEFGVLDNFKDIVREYAKAEIKFSGRGHICENQWLACWVNILSSHKPSKVRKYNQYIANIRGLVDYKKLYNDYANIA